MDSSTLSISNTPEKIISETIRTKIEGRKCQITTILGKNKKLFLIHNTYDDVNRQVTL